MDEVTTATAKRFVCSQVSDNPISDTTSTKSVPLYPKRKRWAAIPQGTIDKVLTEISLGKLTFCEIADKYGVSRPTVGKLAKDRGLVSVFGPEYQRRQALNRALSREQQAHLALQNKNLDVCDPNTLSLIAERASGSIDAHLKPAEKAAVAPVTLVINPELRMIANMFFGAIGDANTGRIIDAEILRELPAGTGV